MRLTIEQTKVSNQIFEVMENLDVIYLTGDAGTGKTVLANHIIETLEGCCDKVIRCSPIAKISDMINGDSKGRTLQSVFKMGGKTVLPEDVNYYPGFKGRINVNTIAERVAKEWAKEFTLNKANVVVYIEECMAASAEELYTVRQVMKILQRNHKLNFVILAVGHPIQQVRDWETPQYSKEEIVCYSYDTKAFKAPRFCDGIEDDGTPIIETKEGFFTNSDEWKVQTFKLTQNIRQANDEYLSEVLNLAVNGKTQKAAQLLVEGLDVEGSEQVHWLGEDDTVDHIDTYLTPSVKVENHFNGLVLDGKEDVSTFLPYIQIENIKGYVEEFSYKSSSVKIDGEWYKIPAKHYHNFVEAWEGIPVPINNRLAAGSSILIRENLEVAKNGESGICKGMTDSTVGVILEKDPDTVHTIGYVQSKAVPTFNGEYVFKLMYLPVMSCVALTTGKIQGWTAPRKANLGICLDAANTNPRPHSLYVALSRAQHLNQINLVISNHEKCPDRSLVEIVANALKLDPECANFHNPREVEKPIIKQQQETEPETKEDKPMTINTKTTTTKIYNLDENPDALLDYTKAMMSRYSRKAPAPVVEETIEETIEETEIEMELEEDADCYDQAPDANEDDFDVDFDEDEDTEGYPQAPDEDEEETEETEETEESEESEDEPEDMLGLLQNLNDELIEELEGKDKLIEKKESALAEQAQLIAELQRQLAKKDKVIADKDSTIKSLENNMNKQAKQHAAELEAKDAKIAELEAKGLTPEKLEVLTNALSILTELGLAPTAPTPKTPKKVITKKVTHPKNPPVKTETKVETKPETKPETKVETKPETKPPHTRVFLDTTVNHNYLRSFVMGLRVKNVVLVSSKEEADVVFTDADLSTNSARKQTLASLK